MARRQVKLSELIWPMMNKSGKEIKLRKSDGGTYDIPPDGRLILPKQVEFLSAIRKYEAVLYGGSMASGKSYILRWALIDLLIEYYLKYGMRKVNVVLLCESYVAIKGRHLDAIESGRAGFPDELGTLIKSPLPEYRLSEEYGGGVIQFRNLYDEELFKSFEYAAMAIDELTMNTEHIFNFLMTRRRYPGLDHVPIFAATNPDGIGREWVIRRFVDPTQRDQPGVNKETGYHFKGFHFIQALPTDNPTLSKQQLDILFRMPEKQRKAYYEGDWSIFEGQFFSLDPEVHFVKPFPIPDTWNKFRAIDHGTAHPTVCLWGAVDHEGTLWVYREHSAVGKPASWHKRIISEASKDDFSENELGNQVGDYILTVGDPKMWIGDGSYEYNKVPQEIYNANDEYGSFKLVRARNARDQGWQALHDAFHYEYEIEPGADGFPHKKLTTKPKIKIFDTCECLISSLKGRMYDVKKGGEDMKKSTGNYLPGEGDDESDALRYLYLAAIKSDYKPDENDIDYGRAPNNARSGDIKISSAFKMRSWAG